MITSTTSGATDKFKTASTVGSCNAGTYPGPDLVYAVTPGQSGMLTASLNATYGSPAVDLRAMCADSSPEIACDYALGAGTTQIAHAVTGGQTYYVIVDSWQSQSGGFTLTLTLN